MTLPGGTVTFLLTDVEDSARAWQERPEETAAAVADLERIITEVVAGNGGHVVKSRGEGDSSFCAFASASRAVVAAVDLQRALQDHALKVRIGVHTGDAELRDGDYYGATPSKCARVRSLAAGGQILCSHATATVAADLPRDVTLRDLGSVRLRSFPEPERVSQVCHPELRDDFAPIDEHETLPAALTSFVGRERERKEVADALRQARLVTLTGAGGSGKSRLAVETARALDWFPSGVWFVDLSSVVDELDIPKTITAVLGLMPADDAEGALAHALSGEAALVILDNCEHQIDAIARLCDSLLQSCRKLTLLTTTREPLGISGELVIRVPSLPDDDAVRLFAERAAAVAPGFSVTPAIEPAVVEICHRLDGIPLAIELAAARAGALPVADILAGLEDRFALLTSGGRTALSRQRTLEASVDWSYELLTEREREVLRVLSVFVDTFSLEGVRAVASDEASIVDTLTALVAKSLVQPVDVFGLPRYRLLDTIRHYARRKLVENGGQPAALRAHMEFYTGLAGRLSESFVTSEQAVSILTAEAELPNFRAAALFALGTDEPNRALEVMPPLWLTALDPRREERTWVRAVLDGTPDGPPDLRFWALLYVASIAWNTRGFGEAFAIAREIEALESRLVLPETRAFAAAFLAVVATIFSITQARSHRERALSEVGDDAYRPAITYLCALAEVAGDRAEQRRLMEDVAAAAAAAGFTLLQTLACGMAASAAIDTGDLASAERRAAEAQELARRFPTGYLLMLRAIPIELALSRGDANVARDLYLESSHLARADAASRMIEADIKLRLAMWDGDAEGALAAVSAADNPVGFTDLLHGLDHVEAALAAGRADAADEFVSRSERALASMEPDTWPGQRATTHVSRARLQLEEGRAGDAVENARAALSFIEAAHLYIGGPDVLRIAGLAYEAAGDVERGVRLAAAGEAMRERIGMVEPPYRIAIDHLREHVDDWAAGSVMTWEEALAYALRGSGARKRPTSGWSSLTPTERQVVDLVVEGLANKEIAARLFMSLPTVKSHLTHAYGKLGLSSRAELIAEATKR